MAGGISSVLLRRYPHCPSSCNEKQKKNPTRLHVERVSGVFLIFTSSLQVLYQYSLKVVEANI